MNSADPAWERRRLLRLSAVTAGGVLFSSTGARTAAIAAPAEEVPPTEDLMREHGVLNRILLIYREAERRLSNGTQFPPEALRQSADVIRTFIEQYHEHLEERFVFPRLRLAGKLVDTVGVLINQHDKGRILTRRILADATPQGLADPATRDRLVSTLKSFDRMYAPHEAREDTVVFPTFRDIMPAREFAEMGERFEAEEHRRFGAAGFTGIVDRVAGIEKELGIYNLSEFTPHV
jgi:hemerythrin-like domain-containing protein